MNKSAEYYETNGDKLIRENRTEEALRAYRHAQDDTMSGVPDFAAYGRIQNKICAALFDDLCKKTGMKKAELAKRCGVTPEHFSRYCTGKQPVPPLVWKEIERIAERNA